MHAGESRYDSATLMNLRTLVAVLAATMVPVLVAPGARAQQPVIEGVWSTALTAPDLEAWEIEDFDCFDGCPVAVRAYMRALLQDPANDDRPYFALEVETTEFARDHLADLLTDRGREFLRTFQEDVAADRAVDFGRFQARPSGICVGLARCRNQNALRDLSKARPGSRGLR